MKASHGDSRGVADVVQPGCLGDQVGVLTDDAGEAAGLGTNLAELRSAIGCVSQLRTQNVAQLPEP